MMTVFPVGRQAFMGARLVSLQGTKGKATPVPNFTPGGKGDSISHRGEWPRFRAGDAGERAEENFFYSKRLGHAMAFATKLHRSQARKGSNVPYVSHLMGVASFVLEYAPIQKGNRFIEAPSKLLPEGVTLEDAVIAAWLHDAVEDQGGKETEAKIRAKFGDTVTKLVIYCSDIEDESTARLSYNERKRAYLHRIANGPDTAMLVSASDKLHNLSNTVRSYWDGGEKVFTLFHGSREDKLRYYQDVVDIFGKTGKHPRLIRDIGNTLAQLRGLIAAGISPGTARE